MLPPAIDLEFSGSNKERRPAPEDFQRELSIFWDALVTYYQKVPVVYPTTGFQKQYLAQMPVERLWIREIIAFPRRPWTIWQFSSRGRVGGLSTFVDLNVFNGTVAGLREIQPGSTSLILCRRVWEKSISAIRARPAVDLSFCSDRIRHFAATQHAGPKLCRCGKIQRCRSSGT